ncbi:hypothetical protein LTS16_016220 [Friedmanniomyces endolithicus]|uniref:Amidase domain-containing protein n=1 Tax=Friedmanniomyces endolithicus TaxID=329885 RepID=A0AAN6FYJ2_9PEZI|nr:hypothetical protein LTS09_001539 [Friedmanniomyces endolithicus]KAK0282574.1 hypothetical protein LTS00_012086 [Friedmanniomyces endolithicus]KAK0324664.1 hypothetical protein LTR82_004369 [Friedmanniomyces endolithicus]KAK0932140.1 hypothetical protein LTR57_000360 [Friedmanniomyces endolithicus]KAK1006835.1 hypothetical protein LTR54_006592 [Friedmanniomyces endolithicus]
MSPATENDDEQPAWQKTKSKKAALQAKAIQPFLDQPPNAVYNTITAIADVEELATRIAKREFTAHDVVSAYIRNDALRRANELDAHLAHHSTPIGPLHGIPITLKDQFDVQGSDTTLGYSGRAFAPAARDAVLVEMLKGMGAVVLAKTNLPQSIMWCETENPLWGLTTHPLNPAFTPGGSTGGEGALLVLQGSLVGWGTDIGGSVRIPAHMCGLYGFKPSSGRLPYHGVPVSTEGQEHVPSVVGPLARSLASVHLVTKAVIDAKPWELDPKVLPLPWRGHAYREMQSRPLVFGLLIDDGVVKVHPPIERVVQEVAAKLREAGHEVIDWDATGHAECIRIMDQYYTADGGEDITRAVSAGGDPFLPHVSALVNRAPAISVYEYWQLNRAKVAAQKAYLDKWRRIRSPKSGREVDVLLTPTMPHSAVPHRACRWVGYTKVWNFLDYTACVLPVGRVDRRLDVARTAAGVAGYVPRSEIDRWNWSLYDPEGMEGMPLSVQLVGQRLEEEKVLGAAQVVERLLRMSSS